MTEKEIMRLAGEFQRNKRQIEILQAANERIKALLVDEISSRGGETLTAGEYKLSSVKVKSARIDSERLKKELPSVYNAFVVVSACKRFNIR